MMKNGQACPGCGCTCNRLAPGRGPHAAALECSRCGRWLRWIPKHVFAELMVARSRPPAEPTDDGTIAWR
jgi:hypothetical protein